MFEKTRQKSKIKIQWRCIFAKSKLRPEGGTDCEADDFGDCSVGAIGSRRMLVKRTSTASRASGTGED
jgi:hypothetical protein